MCQTNPEPSTTGTCISIIICILALLLISILILIARCDAALAKWIALVIVMIIAFPFIWAVRAKVEAWTVEASDERFKKFHECQTSEEAKSALLKERKEFEALHCHLANARRSRWIAPIVALCCAWVWISAWAAIRCTQLASTFQESTSGTTGNTAIRAMLFEITWAELLMFVTMFGVSVFTPIFVCRSLQRHFTDND